ncbi:hypothetical protein Y1Q_0004644 [Alligator mississippiensis]|uniref:Uncharacterized protein n=1 Tax=Alligator mississippiensis TaxID=8496 RepID=A0A151MHV2_ALLMI|nr:hypothetical protein Y1Q_0004644 [Alligator mississippiensis]
MAIRHIWSTFMQLSLSFVNIDWGWHMLPFAGAGSITEKQVLPIPTCVFTFQPGLLQGSKMCKRSSWRADLERQLQIVLK